MHLRAASVVAIGFVLVKPPASLNAQPPDAVKIIHDLDVANQSRYERVLGFTDIEHYAVFRGDDQLHPAAEMTVRMTYMKGIGKTYKILSESGSALVIRYGLRPILENETAINDPARVAQSWFTSANYEMKLKSGNPQTIDGRPCVEVAIAPIHKAPNMIEGSLWVDTRDNTLVKVEGIASKKPSIFAGRTHMMRRYANMQGYAMATHARAESDSTLFGRNVVTIDYSNYQFQISSPRRR